MIGIVSFITSIIAVIMSFFASVRLPSFAIAILAIIVATISAYYKDREESKEGAKKDSRALEVGSIIIAGAAAVSYFAFLFVA